MVWPAWMSDRIVEFIVLENLASWGHFAFALLITTIAGCARRVFWLYAIYQLVTTAFKSAAFPEHTLADWTWDFAGDTVEFLIGIGLAYALGVNDRIQPTGNLAKACSWKGILAGYGVLWLVWAVAFLNALG